MVDLEETYAIPKKYDYFPRMNLKLLNSASLCIEGSQKFITFGSNKDYAYYDTVRINKPDSVFSVNNKIFFNFQNSDKTDSMNLVISHSIHDGIFWNQIFYSSVKIKLLNKFSPDPEKFRLNAAVLVNRYLLKNNDTLIKQVIQYFNINEKSLGLAECGTDSYILKSICEKYNLPCRIIRMQAGDSFESGYADMVGYPTHAVCEIYSSRYCKWYVIDPLYGTVFIKDRIPLNAAEISDLVFSKRVSDIIQDSVLTTRNLTLQNDYFNYYRNIYYDLNITLNGFSRFFMEHFYALYEYNYVQYSHKMHNYMNARIYNTLKTLIYLIISAIYIFIISAFIKNRLPAERNKNKTIKKHQYND